jgi:hypothetical protein
VSASDRVLLQLAEEIFDLQSRTELFQGRESETATCRVVLHAVDRGSALCGREPDGLTPVPCEWDASYLPHVPRCLPCAAKAGSGAPACSSSVRTT